VAGAGVGTRGAAPDFFEPVVGWRVWRVLRRRRRSVLASLFVNVSWPAGAPLEAECHKAGFHSGGHRSPDGSCVCGIYATRLETIDWEFLVSFPLLLRPPVIGRVSLWGSVIEAERGWRASRGYPERIFVPVLGRFGLRRARRIAEGLECYRVPVECLPVGSLADVVPTLTRRYVDGDTYEPHPETAAA
jgi:hypothetical protein